ncbi:MAG: hypothetical protein IV086_18505 [Hyphomonadaceae bacterium]|nr:MAG: hypothetical protein FD160_3323 [Caulobacteraceae bacterium]MBT9447690.1 hypothetical protein [Hyphomonadaceae bacterium]TPW06803.1 MAG: hypothetical protein FD124_1551 [Alphaproteobacteria bacterium]
MKVSPVLSSLAALLSACAAAAPVAPDASALRGCWIERRGDQTITQRWFPEDGGWRGDEITYFQKGDPEHGRWKLTPGDDAAPWRMCMVELAMASAPPCWRAFFGPGKGDGDDQQWVEIEAEPETLKITYLTAGERAITYDGRRDGCD